jgi:single-stranded DNA-binding protein
MHHVFIDCQHQDIQASDISKGTMLHITGKIQTRTVIDGDGVKQYKTEIMIQQLTPLQVPVEI